jgi:hypothetical protein
MAANNPGKKPHEPGKFQAIADCLAPDSSVAVRYNFDTSLVGNKGTFSLVKDPAI